MIGSLQGRLQAKHAPAVVVECHGVGYEVETPMSTFLELPRTGEDVFLHTHLLVREDAQILYGFCSVAEKTLFRLLIRVTGVGAKMALAVLSTLSVSEFQRCIQYEDAATLVKVPGIGKRTAERLIVDMRDKIDIEPAPATLRAGPVAAAPDARNEAVDALIALGYKPKEVSRLIDGLETDELSAEDIIRLALKQVAI